MNIALSDLVIFFALAAFIYLWWLGKAVKERAIPQVKLHCKKFNVQLLDDTISQQKTRIIWHKGQIKIKRQFCFEFTSTGEARYQGSISFINQKLDHINLDPHHF